MGGVGVWGKWRREKGAEDSGVREAVGKERKVGINRRDKLD